MTYLVQATMDERIALPTTRGTSLTVASSITQDEDAEARRVDRRRSAVVRMRRALAA
jgi:hypothetical protein